MNKSIIDKMNREEILELFSPYKDPILNGTGQSYYDMIKGHSQIRIELVQDSAYTQGRIDVYIVSMFAGDRWTGVGSVGRVVYDNVVSKYHEMIRNRRDTTIGKIINA
jgi:hypothetical protein